MPWYWINFRDLILFFINFSGITKVILKPNSSDWTRLEWKGNLRLLYLVYFKEYITFVYAMYLSDKIDGICLFVPLFFRNPEDFPDRQTRRIVRDSAGQSVSYVVFEWLNLVILHVYLLKHKYLFHSRENHEKEDKETSNAFKSNKHICRRIYLKPWRTHMSKL